MMIPKMNFKELAMQLTVPDDLASLILSSQIEEGYLQAERGELMDAAQAQLEIQAMKQDWRSTTFRVGYEDVQSALLLVDDLL